MTRADIGWRIALAIMALFVASAAIVRLVALPQAMTHVDDIGVAATILEARREFRHVEDLRAALNNPRLRQYDSPKFRLLRSVDQAGLLGPTYGLLAVARDALAVPARWTYAPGQYVVTGALVSEEASYREQLVRGRAPSAIASVLAILALGVLAWRRRRPEELAAPLVATAVMAFSLEFLAYSTHMSNYALGVLAVTLLLGLVSRPEPPSTWRGAAALGAAMWALVMLSYQVLPLVAAALAAIALSAVVRDTRRWTEGPAALLRALGRPWFRRLVLAAAVFAVLMLPVYLVLLTSVRPITWNAGANGEFVFKGFAEGGGAVGALRFLVENAWLVFSAMTAPIPWTSPVRAVVTGVLAGFFLLGVARLLGDRSRPERFTLGLFILIACGLTALMALMGLTALSPTRHALILLPLFACGAGEGAALLLSRLRGPERLRLGATCLIVGGLAALWAVALPESLSARRDPLREADLAALVARQRPAAILAYDHTYAVELMPGVRSQAPVFNEQNLNFPWLDGRTPAADGPVIAISTNGPLDADRRRLLGEALRQAGPTGLRWCPDAAAVVEDVRTGVQTLEVYPIAAGGLNGYYLYMFPRCAGGRA